MASQMQPVSDALDRPMRVLRVLTRPNLGGPTRQAIALWRAHRDAGVETLLVTGVVGPEESSLAPADHGVPEAPASGARAGHLRLEDMKRGVDPFADARARRALRQLIQSFRPDVVHTHTSKAGLIGRRAALDERVPVVAHTFHGHVLKDYFGPAGGWWLRRMERRLARRTSLLFAVSSSCAVELAELGVAARERLVVTPPAVDAQPALDRSDARARVGLEPDVWAVAAVGRLVPIKRFGDFVTMVAGDGRLRGDIFGDGPLRASLEPRAERLCRGRLRLLGAVPEAARLLRAYDAVVLPSIREGCPLVAIEAFAAGVPVVGYDVPGVRDALASLGKGLLVPVADGPPGLLAAAARLREDAGLRQELTAASVAAAATCRPDAVGAALCEHYRRALAGAR